MAIAIARVDFSGPPPTVAVTSGFAGLTSYTIALMPQDMDLTNAVPFVTADVPADVDAEHDLTPVWPCSENSFIVVFGGIGATIDPPQFAVTATLTQNGQVTPMTTTIAPGTSAATFVCSVELQS